MTAANKVICTVGTSLKTNIENGAGEQYADLRKLWNDGQWGQAARALARCSPDERICGAEINSLHSLLGKERLVQPNADLVFCVSDTEDGRHTGEVLQSYFKDRGHRVQLEPIEGLQDKCPEEFRVQGLRNLASKIGGIVRGAGDPRYVAINATGGYKAQIAIAVLIGQTLGVPVYYKHERFDTIISLPPMPVAFDYDLLGWNADIFFELEKSGQQKLTREGFESLRMDGRMDERMEAFLDRVEEDDRILLALNPVGQIYLEGYRQRHPAGKDLPPPAAPEQRSEPKFRDDNYPKGFQDFVWKVWNEQLFITGCHTLSYDHNRGIRDRRFRIRQNDGQIVGEYRDDDFGARFAITTTAQTQGQKLAVVEHLNAEYGRG